MTPDASEVLWKKIKKDHIPSFEQLYRLTYKKLGNLCYKIIQDQEAVKDILQECYVSLYQKKDQLPEDLQVEAYLYNCAKFSAFKYLRDVIAKKQALFVSYKSDQDYASYHQADPPYSQEDFLSGELVEHVLSSIAELPERCRNAFMLKYFQNMSYREISEKMEISPKTVEKHVNYGLNILRKKFRKNQILFVVLLAGALLL